VGFRRYDDGWRVIEGSAPKSNQGLDDALKNSEPELDVDTLTLTH
jgi:hypothetical protein